MKKIILLLVISFAFNFSKAQISVGPRHVGTSKKFKNDEFKKFKNTETIFVLSNALEKDAYLEILDNVWDVTPYKVINVDDFNKEDYLGNYSIATINGFTRTKTMKSGAKVSSLYIYIEFALYDSEKLQADLKKNAGAKKSKIEKIYKKHKLSVSRIELYPTDEFIITALKSDDDEIVNAIYTKNVFHNYDSGFLQNYFQKVNNLIKNEEIYWMYETDFLPELKTLKNKTLYIPNYLTTKYDALKIKEKKLDELNEKEKKRINEVYSSYAYKYEIQDDDVLNERILAGEEFYYLRYARINSQKFLHIVNSKTGEVVYRFYTTGFAYNVKAKHIKEINQRIKKALKK